MSEKLKKAFDRFLERMLLNEKGELSFSKFGGQLVAVCMMLINADKAGVYPPDWITHWAYIIVWLGAGLGFAGFRDAISKIVKKEK